MLSKASECDIIVMPYENATVGKIGDVEGLKDAKSIAIIIGSEGGFDDSEVEKAKQIGANIVSLGKRILRCETAAIATCALIEYESGEMNI